MREQTTLEMLPPSSLLVSGSGIAIVERINLSDPTAEREKELHTLT
ncbi:MAG: hypothetical protein OCU16_03600 [Candidatus Methanospirare jalkutatii]|nr:hypothetical protein [Candidatus Methanospirare jalkutatii]